MMLLPDDITVQNIIIFLGLYDLSIRGFFLGYESDTANINIIIGVVAGVSAGILLCVIVGIIFYCHLKRTRYVDIVNDIR